MLMVTLEKAKILIVEDQRNVAKYIRESLESFGFVTIQMAESGEEAVRKVKESNPDEPFHARDLRQGIEVALRQH